MTGLIVRTGRVSSKWDPALGVPVLEREVGTVRRGKAVALSEDPNQTGSQTDRCRVAPEFLKGRVKITKEVQALLLHFERLGDFLTPSFRAQVEDYKARVRATQALQALRTRRK